MSGMAHDLTPAWRGNPEIDLSAARVELRRATVRTEDGAVLLDAVAWTVRRGEHWTLIGPNGAGKTTLLSLASATRHPTTGQAWVLGTRLGRVDMRELRAGIGFVDPRLPVHGRLTALEVVLTGASGTLVPLHDRYDDADRDRARELLAAVECAELGTRAVATLSHGERQRVLLARALMPEPELLLLDEPATGLDLPGREALLATLERLAAEDRARATVVVSHHLEDVPASTTHALLLAHGRVVATGPVDTVLADAPMTTCFGVPVRVRRDEGRFWARAARPPQRQPVALR